MLGIPRREAARRIAAATGRPITSVNAQVWEWDVGRRTPDLRSLRSILDVIDYDLALVEKHDPDAPREWPRLNDPPTDVQHVRSMTGTLWTRMAVDGHYWSAPGWDDGVSWAQVLRWGPITEVKDA